jgi:2,4-dihydroxy-1,4-benzoxazin-3-one-glucoside dioxygenase
MMLDYGEALMKVARHTLELLSESLGMPSDHLHEMERMKQLHIVCQYYPPCPFHHDPLAGQHGRPAGAR